MQDEEQQQSKGWIKLHRDILEWEWYDDINTRILFIHLLLTANYTEKKWRSITIKEGQLCTGRESLAKSSGLSEQSVRTSLNKLKLTNEITIHTTAKHSIISIVNWSKYQTANQQLTLNLTNDQPTTNQQLTTTKERKELKKEKNKASVKFFENKKNRYAVPSQNDGVNNLVKEITIRGRKEYTAADRLARTEQFLKTGKYPD